MVPFLCLSCTAYPLSVLASLPFHVCSPFVALDPFLPPCSLPSGFSSVDIDVSSSTMLWMILFFLFLTPNQPEVVDLFSEFFFFFVGKCPQRKHCVFVVPITQVSILHWDIEWTKQVTWVAFWMFRDHINSSIELAGKKNRKCHLHSKTLLTQIILNWNNRVCKTC